MQKKHMAGLAKTLAAITGIVIAVSVSLSAAHAEFDLSRECSVKVGYGHLSETASDQEYEKDRADANIVFDLYKVGGAVQAPGEEKDQSYSYQAVGAFTDLGERINNKEITQEEWEAIAQEAAAIVRDSDADTVIAGAEVGGDAISRSDDDKAISTGLYLLIAHGSDLDKAEYFKDAKDKENGTTSLVSIANSPQWEYQFKPQLLSLPMNGNPESGEYFFTTANPDEWVYDYEIELKPGREPRFGDLIIDKIVSTYGGKNAVFAFTVTATLDGEVVYTNAVGFNVDSAGKYSKTLKNIPVGSTVVVTEEYSGMSFTAEQTELTTTIIPRPEGTASVEFKNDHDDTHTRGHGVTNTITAEDGVEAKDADGNPITRWGWSKGWTTSQVGSDDPAE